jgi:hypothetical protein
MGNIISYLSEVININPPYSWTGPKKGWRDAENAVDSGL